MEILKAYMSIQHNNIPNISIYSEYIYLEVLCSNTIFYDSNKMEEVMHINKNDENNNKVRIYYTNKMNYIKCYLTNLTNLNKNESESENESEIDLGTINLDKIKIKVEDCIDR